MVIKRRMPDLKLHLFGLHLPQDALTLFQGQAEILVLRLFDVAPNSKNLSPRQNAGDPAKLRPDLHLNCPRHCPAPSLNRFQLTRPVQARRNFRSMKASA